MESRSPRLLLSPPFLPSRMNFSQQPQVAAPEATDPTARMREAQKAGVVSGLRPGRRELGAAGEGGGASWGRQKTLEGLTDTRWPGHSQTVERSTVSSGGPFLSLWPCVRPTSTLRGQWRGGRAERDEGCCDAGMIAQLALPSAHSHESPRASQEEALPLSAPTGGATGWAPARRVLVEIPTLLLI